MGYSIYLSFTQYPVPKTFGPVNGQIKRVLWKDLDKWSREIYSKWENNVLNDFKKVEVQRQPNSLLIVGEYNDSIPKEELLKDWHTKYFPWLYQEIEYNSETKAILDMHSRKLDMWVRKQLMHIIQVTTGFFKDKLVLLSRAVTFAHGGIVAELKLLDENGNVIQETSNKNIYDILRGGKNEKKEQQKTEK